MYMARDEKMEIHQAVVRIIHERVEKKKKLCNETTISMELMVSNWTPKKYHRNDNSIHAV